MGLEYGKEIILDYDAKKEYDVYFSAFLKHIQNLVVLMGLSPHCSIFSSK